MENNKPTDPFDPMRCFSSDPAVRSLAMELYEGAAGLPIISPHGHVDPALFSDPDASFGSPADLFIIPDHYVTRMLYSQGVPLELLLHGDHRMIWRTFCENFPLFRGTPSGLWLRHELQLFGIDQAPSGENADSMYELISARLAEPECRPRRLFERFNIELLATTDAATDMLDDHRAIRRSGWQGSIIPTFRPDAVTNLDAPGWRDEIDVLSEVTGLDVADYRSFLRALEQRREYFRGMGAHAADHAALSAVTAELSPVEADAVFQRALRGRPERGDAEQFTAHMLMEMARMSVDDGMAMQLHPGSLRNYDPWIYSQYGPDRGADIPVRTEFTRSLKPLLNKYGREPNLMLIVFTLDEAALSRELAPLAGFYPALKLGPPWWFLDSLNGIRRYFDTVMETAGLFNTVGFNDDTRAFCSIPARHDVWRRASANWLAGLAARHIISLDEAHTMMADLVYHLAKRAYGLD